MCGNQPLGRVGLEFRQDVQEHARSTLPTQDTHLEGHVRVWVFAQVGAADVDEKDDVFIILAPQSIVGNSIVPLLEEMVEAAAGRPIITINGRLDDVQSAAGVMSYPRPRRNLLVRNLLRSEYPRRVAAAPPRPDSAEDLHGIPCQPRRYRGRGDRLDFVDAWKEIFHFSLIVPTGRTFYPILGAVCMPLLGAPYALYFRRADLPKTGRGDAAAATWIFRGDESRRCRGRDADIPWRRESRRRRGRDAEISRRRLARFRYQRLELCTEKDRRFANSVERAAAARAGELSETYRPIGCFAEFPTGKEQKLAFREAAKLVMEGIY